MINSFNEFLEEEKAYYSNAAYDKKGFPEVDRTYMQYSKASKKTLKELAVKYKLDWRGGKKTVLTRILTKMHGSQKVQGYYNRVGDSEFQYMRKKEEK